MRILKKRNILFGLPLFIAAVLTAGSPALAAGEDVPGYQVKVVLKTGASYEAVVMDRSLYPLMEKGKAVDLSKLKPDRMITLYYVGGMNGSMGVRVGDLKSVSTLLPLKEEELKDMKNAINRRVEALNEKEKVRLAKLAERRAQELKAREAEEANRKALTEAEAKKKLEAERLKWILRFPPEEGWGPEKKAELYRRSIAVGVYPNSEEYLFLNNYKEWLDQYQYWKVLQEKKAKEKAAEEGGKVEDKTEGKGENKEKEPEQKEEKGPSGYTKKKSGD